MRAAGVGASTASVQEARPSASLRAALHSSAQFGRKDIIVRPVPYLIAKQMCERHHYLASYPGESVLNFGVFVANRLLGVAVLGAGPSNVHYFFEGAKAEQVLCLSRCWLDDLLARNSESRVLAIILRHLRRYQTIIKAIVAYSDPMAGHSGIIYRAAGFLYLGQSTAMPGYMMPDGRVYHSRTLSHSFGTHSIAHFEAHDVRVESVPRVLKLIYVAFIDGA